MVPTSGLQAMNICVKHGPSEQEHALHTGSQQTIFTNEKSIGIPNHRTMDGHNTQVPFEFARAIQLANFVTKYDSIQQVAAVLLKCLVRPILGSKGCVIVRVRVWVCGWLNLGYGVW